MNGNILIYIGVGIAVCVIALIVLRFIPDKKESEAKEKKDKPELQFNLSWSYIIRIILAGLCIAGAMLNCSDSFYTFFKWFCIAYYFFNAYMQFKTPFPWVGFLYVGLGVFFIDSLARWRPDSFWVVFDWLLALVTCFEIFILYIFEKKTAKEQ